MNRAVRANEAARSMMADPDNRNAVLRRQLPNKPVVNRYRGNYEYQVVLKLSGQGSSFETRYIIQTRDKHSASELIDMALNQYRTTTALQENYRNKVQKVGPLPTPTGWVVAASFFDPTRGGTK